MIVDTSALCAIVFKEPERAEFVRTLLSDERHFISAVNAYEAGMVVESRLGDRGARDLADLMATAGIDVVAFDAGMAEVALDAWRRFGKGRHRAGLNFADCAAYALAKVTRQPLLFKGDDFNQTDILTV